MFGKTALHFFINECQPMYMFYLGWYTVVSHSASFDRGQMPRRRDAMSLEPDAYQACMLADVGTALFTFSQNIKGKCVDIDRNPWGYLNLSGLILVAGMVGNMMVHLFMEKRKLKAKGLKFGYTSGHYVAFTFKMQGKKWYTSLAYVLLSYTTLAGVFVVYHGLMSPTYAMMFLTGQAPSILLCAYTAYSLTARHDSVFGMGNKRFQALHFKRGKGDVLLQSNDALAVRTEQAVFHAFHKQFHFMEEIIDFEKSGFKGITKEELMEEAFLALHPKKACADDAGEKKSAENGEGYVKLCGGSLEKPQP